MSKSIPIEVARILRNIPLEYLRGLAKAHGDKDIGSGFRGLLNFLLMMDQDHITRGSGAVTSMDSMINATVDQTFYRGRISLGVLINTLITHAPEFLEKRSEESKKKLTPYGKAR